MTLHQAEANLLAASTELTNFLEFLTTSTRLLALRDNLKRAITEVKVLKSIAKECQGPKDTDGSCSCYAEALHDGSEG